MTAIEVTHTAGRYRVHIAAGALRGLDAFLASHHGEARRVVIADAAVAAALPALLPDAELLTFPGGEHQKTREQWHRLTDELLARRYGRDTVIIAFGGGVTTDLAGFVAATLHRGVPWVAVPTTTLAMIDAAVGGKTGVDTAHGKNLVGAFHPPAAVFIDPDTLVTLPARSYREGLAEAVKHAAILDAPYGDWIVQHAGAIIARDTAIVTELVRWSVELKAGVVSGDEAESGRRAILNAGHTVAHALEQASDFLIPHGEAVAIGLMLETRVAEAGGIAEAGSSTRLEAMLRAVGLPTAMPAGIDRERLLPAMQSDKKNRRGVVRAALIARIGAVAQRDGDWTCPLDLDLLETMIRA